MAAKAQITFARYAEGQQSDRRHGQVSKRPFYQEDDSDTLHDAYKRAKSLETLPPSSRGLLF